MGVGAVIFRDRTSAGGRLVAPLSSFIGRPDVIVLGLPRGGVPVAAEVARRLHLPLDVLVVRKLGLPWQPEVAFGALASGGAWVANPDIIASAELDPEEADRIVQREARELARRERLYRGSRPYPDLRGRTVILVDDGAATGATMLAAIKALRRLKVRQVVAALPVVPPDTLQRLRKQADEVVCLNVPERLGGVGAWYMDFTQTTDNEVRELLADNERTPKNGRVHGGSV